ncbi:MAG: 23S rRNA (guanosine(2251)-2'-O)-methyltransferase RlmB [Edaphocola sp.]
MNRPFNRQSKPTLPKSRLIIGRKPLLEALEAGSNIEKIFVLQNAGGEEINSIRKLAKEANIAVSSVPPEKLQRFTQANHQGVVAIAGLVAYQPLQEVISMAVDKGETPLVIVLDGITDTRNLGAMARSAHCYGAHALVIPASNSAAITEDSIKTSAGALEHLPVCRVASVEQAIDLLKLNGLLVAATALHDSTPISTADLTAPLAIVMGAEDKGVSNFVLKTADLLLRIPMAGNFDSLNVSVATGIVLYEVLRQKRAVG